MSLIYSILFVLLLLIGLLFTVAMEIKLLFDTMQNQYNVSFQWLYPFLEVEYEIDGTKPMMTVFIFEKKVYRKAITKKQKKSKGKGGLIKAAALSDVQVTTAYGFKNPAFTGIVCGALQIAQRFVSADTKQFPDFVTTNDYITMNASAKVNVGSTVVNLTKNKIRMF